MLLCNQSLTAYILYIIQILTDRFNATTQLICRAQYQTKYIKSTVTDRIKHVSLFLKHHIGNFLFIIIAITDI